MQKINISGIEVIVEDADSYLQINDINGADLARIWPQIANEYAGFDKWLCFHNSKIPAEMLNKIGAVLEDDSIDMRLNSEGFCYSGPSSITRLTERAFGEFSAYHDRRNPDMYWTGERIGRDLSRWGIFTLCKNVKIAGYSLVYIGNPVLAEIFCVDAPDIASGAELIKSAARLAFDNGKKEVVYMADEHTVGKDAAQQAGFTAAGFYKGYVIKRTYRY